MSEIERYKFTNGWTMQREEASPFFWMLSDETGKHVCRDQYRHDLFARYKLDVAEHVDPFDTPTHRKGE